LRTVTTTPTQWHTSAGTFDTTKKAQVQFILPELHEGRTIVYKAHIAKQLGRYDMILGRDLLKELGIKLDFGDETVTWDEMTIPMKPENATVMTSYHLDDSPAVDEATKRIKGILDAKYEAANLDEVVAECKHLTDSEKISLRQILD
jgi:hypothetical protein